MVKIKEDERNTREYNNITIIVKCEWAEFPY